MPSQGSSECPACGPPRPSLPCCSVQIWHRRLPFGSLPGRRLLAEAVTQAVVFTSQFIKLASLKKKSASSYEKCVFSVWMEADFSMVSKETAEWSTVDISKTPNYSFGSRQQQELTIFTLMLQRCLCWCKDSMHFWLHVHKKSEIWIPESSEVCTVCDNDQVLFSNSIILKVSLEARLKLQVTNVDLEQQTTAFSVCHLSWGPVVSTRYVRQQMETGFHRGRS